MNGTVTRHEDNWHGLNRRLHGTQRMSAVASGRDSMFVRGQRCLTVLSSCRLSVEQWLATMRSDVSAWTTSFADAEDGGIRASAWMSSNLCFLFDHVASHLDVSDWRYSSSGPNAYHQAGRLLRQRRVLGLRFVAQAVTSAYAS